MTTVRLEPAALRSRVKHSTTEPLRSLSSFYIGPDNKGIIEVTVRSFNKGPDNKMIIEVTIS